ncbi:MAG: glycoside hydrolase family 88 protein [Egibacteraceae bacterium]
MQVPSNQVCNRRRLLMDGGVAGVGLASAWAVGLPALAACADAPARLGQPPISSGDRLLFAQSLSHSVARIRALVPAAEAHGFPQSTQAGHWTYKDKGGWTGGFWPGQLWLASVAADDQALADAAGVAAGRLAPRRTDASTHDLGFLFYPSWVTAFRLTGDGAWRDGALVAAESLAKRFNPRGGFIRAWGRLDSPVNAGRAIVDTMMNLDLLFWASAETGNDRFADIARRHAATSAARHVRDDGSTTHVFDFDPGTGAPIGQGTRQGYSLTSCWARGQAWAVYGFTTAYRRTENELFLDTARKTADWFLSHLPADAVPFWDFRSPDLPRDVRDSSAGAIAACGLLDLAGVAGEYRYREGGLRILRALCQGYTTSRMPAHEAILLHGTGNKPSNDEVDVSLVYGDYYFVEALMRLLHFDKTAPAIGL